MKAWIGVVTLLSVASAQASAPVDSTLERLAKVETFAFGPTGEAGSISPGEKDFRLILGRPSASADFERLFSVGNLQAKTYALVGLRATNPTRFKKLSSSLRDSKEVVATQAGCIIYHESLGAVLKPIEAGHLY